MARSTSAAVGIPAPTLRSTARRRTLGSTVARYRTPAIALLVVLIATIAAVTAPWISPYDPIEGDTGRRLQPPALTASGGQFLLGTDHLGRDVLSRLIWGGRVSLLVGFVSVVVAGVLGIALGAVSGYHRGLLDEVIMRIADIQLSFPFLGLAIAVVAVLGPGLTNVVVVLGVSGWILFARVIRAEFLGLREREFVQAARALGAGDGRILWRHLLPNVVGPTTVVATFAFAQMVITEASLSFLGLGVPPSVASWGNMLAIGRNYLQSGWWVATFPGVAITLTVVAINLIGDWLRDELDPTLRTE